jgi:excisionase family DNA binding protein
MEDAAAFAVPEPLLTIDDVADWLNVHSRTVKRLIARRELLAIKVAGATRLDPEDVRAYLEGQRVPEAAEALRSSRRPLRVADATSQSFSDRVRSPPRRRGEES